MTKKILVFGYIPKYKGGKQLTGLATGIFDLHNAVNSNSSSFETIIAATDIHKKEILINNTRIIGWNKKILFKHSIKNPIKILFFLWKIITLNKFWVISPFFKTFIKIIFLDYAINKIKPDVIHFHGASGALLSICLWKKQKKVLRLHGINGFNKSILNYKKHRKLEQFITKLDFDMITFISNNNKQEWKKKYGHFNCEMKVILNGFNPLLFFPKQNVKKEYDLITIAGMSENKGQARIVKSIVNLKEEELNISYISIGKINFDIKNKIEQLTKNKDIKIIFKDYLSQEELVNYLHISKYFIMPSFAEGFGKVFIESIGAGTPVIIPKHLPLAKEKEILNKDNSILINDSSTKSITDSLRVIFSSNKDYLSINVSNTVKKLNWDNIALEYINIYKLIFNNN